MPVFTVSVAPPDAGDAAEADHIDAALTGYWYDDEVTEGIPAVLTMAREETNVMPISLAEFLHERATDPFCQAVAQQVGTWKSKLDYDRYGLLVRKSPLEGALQRVVPKSLLDRLLYLSHYPRLAGHPGGTRMYYTLRRDYYMPMMANDVRIHRLKGLPLVSTHPRIRSETSEVSETLPCSWTPRIRGDGHTRSPPEER